MSDDETHPQAEVYEILSKLPNMEPADKRNGGTAHGCNVSVGLHLTTLRHTDAKEAPKSGRKEIRRNTDGDDGGKFCKGPTCNTENERHERHGCQVSRSGCFQELVSRLPGVRLV